MRQRPFPLFPLTPSQTSLVWEIPSLSWGKHTRGSGAGGAGLSDRASHVSLLIPCFLPTFRWCDPTSFVYLKLPLGDERASEVAVFPPTRETRGSSPSFLLRRKSLLCHPRVAEEVGARVSCIGIARDPCLWPSFLFFLFHSWIMYILLPKERMSKSSVFFYILYIK